MNLKLQPASSMPEPNRWWDATILCAAGIPFLFWGLGMVTFLDPDEGLYGSIAREMAVGRDWITPHFNGVRYLEKPPLLFWLSALTMTLFGPSEWAVRLWSALPAFGTALLIRRMGGWLYGRPAGLLAAIVFVTSAGVFRYVRVAATDFLLVFSITLAIFGFLKAYLGRSSAHSQQPMKRDFVSDQSPMGRVPSRLPAFQPSGLVLFYLGMALGVLAKGFIGLVFPLMIVGMFLILAKGKEPCAGGNRATDRSKVQSSKFEVPPLRSYPVEWRFRLLHGLNDLRLMLGSPWGVALFLALVAPWHLLAAWKNPGFVQFYMLDNQLLRFLNARAFLEDDVPIRTLSFLVITLVWFFPWSLVLPACIRKGFPRSQPGMALHESARLVVGIWSLGILAFFCLSLSKLEHYSLPAIPALSLMVGGRWGEAFGAGPGSVRRRDGLKWCLGLAAVGCVAAGSAVLAAGERVTPGMLLAGLAKLNVYYRILKAQGAAFPFASAAPFQELLQALGWALLLCLPLSFVVFMSRMPRAGFFSLVSLSAVIGVLILKLLVLIEPYHSSEPVARALTRLSIRSGPIVHDGSLEYSAGLPFYTERHIYVLNGKRGDLDFGSRYPETRHLFLDGRGFARLWHGNRQLFLVTRPRTGSSILDTMPSQRLHLVGRYGPRWVYTNRPPSSTRRGVKRVNSEK